MINLMLTLFQAHIASYVITRSGSAIYDFPPFFRLSLYIKTIWNMDQTHSNEMSL